MYDGVYKEMVNAGVAVEHDKEKMFDVDDKIVNKII
jgi:hypothetical protein